MNSTTTAELNGLFPPGFQPQGRQRFDVGAPPPPGERQGRRVEIADARILQAQSGLSEAQFLARHGFVLLQHQTAVQDWDMPVEAVYGPEVETLIRGRLLPGRRVEIRVGGLLRRGRGTTVPFYATGVHSDGGQDLNDYVFNIDAFAGEEAARGWGERYARDDVEGLVWLDFWRPTNMAGPLEHMPLALCDTDSVEQADLVPTALTGVAPQGRETHHLRLRFNESQRWAYYPGMRRDEVIAFKLSEFWKGPTPPRNCFHSAFTHPDAPAGAERRQSCELRVGVLMLKD